VRPVRGAVSMAMNARARGLSRLPVPAANAREAAVVKSVQVYGIGTLAEAVGLLAGELALQPVTADVDQLDARLNRYAVDFADVRAREFAKRALMAVANGGHNVLTL
jgi:magnesium chelatase family protein